MRRKSMRSATGGAGAYKECWKTCRDRDIYCGLALDGNCAPLMATCEACDSRSVSSGSVRGNRTGEPVTWRKQSGSDSSGKILGLTGQQALIALGVGVAAYFIIKKVK